MERKTFFVDVLLPLPVAGTFTYRVPYELNNQIKKGIRVVVQFGRKKVYSALVYRVHEQVPTSATKFITTIIDKTAIVQDQQFTFWEWIAHYYCCSLGEVMACALPSALKLASESKLVLHSDFNGDISQLTEKEFLLVDALELRNILTISEAIEITEQQHIFPLINNLVEKKVVYVYEELKELYKPKKEYFLLLNAPYKSGEKLSELIDQLEKRAFKQLEYLMAYLQLCGDIQQGNEVNIRKLLATLRTKNRAPLKTLIDKGILLQKEHIVSRFNRATKSISTNELTLSLQQEKALQNIKNAFTTHSTTLLHGVTSSGKTEIYIKLIEEYLAKGKQILYLLPEIALTSQIIKRLQRYFGEKVGVYHSKFNNQERVETWHATSGMEGENSAFRSYPIIIGARSAVFLPYTNLGLIIIDEEHDTSYKQVNPAPRYQARDCAIVLAQLHSAHTLLGSATPSVESWYNAKQGKYGFVQLLQRYGDVNMPQLLFPDNKKREKHAVQHEFSPLLIEEIKKALEKKEQIILFRNRRGFAPLLECNDCGHTPECTNCDVSMVYHKNINRLRCHYCGYTKNIPSSCPECGSKNMKMVGFGTQKIEENLQILFPDASIGRMDLDTTRGKNAHQQIISSFENCEIDILVGTQMVTKGLDFQNVTLVGILSIDNLLNYPDFRAHEHGFQLLMQVAGRAGRNKTQGSVVVQTKKTDHYIIRLIEAQNYDHFYESQLQERKRFSYPPYARMIKITFLHQEKKSVDEHAGALTQALQLIFGKRVLGPEYPVISRIRNRYLKHTILKLEQTISVKKCKSEMLKVIEAYRSNHTITGLRIVIDVDPE